MNESNPAYDRPSELQIRDAETLVARFAALWRQPDPETFRALMHADTRNLVPPMTEPADREGAMRHFNEFVRQLPGMSVAVQRWALAGETVMIEWRATAKVMPAHGAPERGPRSPAIQLPAGARSAN